jgi:sporulation protein YlmC with PRC-barrel domain
MEISYNKLKQKCVVSVIDGKNLGKVCDVVYFYPQNTIKGYFVTGGKGFRLTRQDVFIPVANIIKIGEDVVLTNFGEKPPERKGECRSESAQGGAPYGEKCCPPQGMPPCSCGEKGECRGAESSRRSYEEYE